MDFELFYTIPYYKKNTTWIWVFQICSQKYETLYRNIRRKCLSLHKAECLVCSQNGMKRIDRGKVPKQSREFGSYNLGKCRESMLFIYGKLCPALGKAWDLVLSQEGIGAWMTRGELDRDAHPLPSQVRWVEISRDPRSNSSTLERPLDSSSLIQQKFGGKVLNLEEEEGSDKRKETVAVDSSLK